MKFILIVTILTHFGPHATSSVDTAELPSQEACIAMRDDTRKFRTSDGVSVFAECVEMRSGDAR